MNVREIKRQLNLLENCNCYEYFYYIEVECEENNKYCRGIIHHKYAGFKVEWSINDLEL